MKKLFYVIILFFIFVINVNAERCFSVPRCNGTTTTYVTQCYALPRTTSIKMVVNTPVYSNSRTINVSVNPENYTVNSGTTLYIPEIDGYVFSRYTYGSSTVSTIYGLKANPTSYRTITGTRCVFSSSGSVSSATVSVGGRILCFKLTGSLGGSNQYSFNTSSVQFTDINGDGLPDHVLQIAGQNKMQVIDGIELTLKTMKCGERARVVLRSDYAWGEYGTSDGSVAPYTPVVFDVELQKVSE